VTLASPWKTRSIHLGAEALWRSSLSLLLRAASSSQRAVRLFRRSVSSRATPTDRGPCLPLCFAQPDMRALLQILADAPTCSCPEGHLLIDLVEAMPGHSDRLDSRWPSNRLLSCAHPRVFAVLLTVRGRPVARPCRESDRTPLMGFVSKICLSVDIQRVCPLPTHDRPHPAGCPADWACDDFSLRCCRRLGFVVSLRPRLATPGLVPPMSFPTTTTAFSTHVV